METRCNYVNLAPARWVRVLRALARAEDAAVYVRQVGAPHTAVGRSTAASEPASAITVVVAKRATAIMAAAARVQAPSTMMALAASAILARLHRRACRSQRGRRSLQFLGSWARFLLRACQRSRWRRSSSRGAPRAWLQRRAGQRQGGGGRRSAGDHEHGGCSKRAGATTLEVVAAPVTSGIAAPRSAPAPTMQKVTASPGVTSSSQQRARPRQR